MAVRGGGLRSAINVTITNDLKHRRVDFMHFDGVIAVLHGAAWRVPIPRAPGLLSFPARAVLRTRTVEAQGLSIGAPMNLMPIELVSLSGDHLVTDSQRVARHFSRRHDDVLRAINRLDCSGQFRLRNFAETVSHRENPSGGRPIASRYVQMTKNGFVFLAMGFTGSEAARIKEAYIEAFDSMAEQLERRDLSLMRRLLDHELRDKDSRQRGQIAGRLLVTRKKEKRSLSSEERRLRAEAQPALFQLVKGGS